MLEEDSSVKRRHDGVGVELLEGRWRSGFGVGRKTAARVAERLERLGTERAHLAEGVKRLGSLLLAARQTAHAAEREVVDPSAQNSLRSLDVMIIMVTVATAARPGHTRRAGTALRASGRPFGALGALLPT